MDGGETSFPRITLKVGWRVLREVVMKLPREPRRSNWKSTEVGVRARGVERTAARKVLKAPEVEAEERVLEAMGRLPPEGLPPPGEEQARGVSRGRLADPTGARRCLRPRSGCQILKASGQC
jgi:hypothetical protein